MSIAQIYCTLPFNAFENRFNYLKVYKTLDTFKKVFKVNDVNVKMQWVVHWIVFSKVLLVNLIQ